MEVLRDTDGAAVDDALVLVDGHMIPLLHAGHYAGSYFASEGETPPMERGNTLHIEVRRGGLAVTGAVLVPRGASLYPPDRSFAMGEDLPVEWSGDPGDHHYWLHASWEIGGGPSTGSYIQPLAWNASPVTIPAASLGTESVQVRIVALNDAVFAGDVAPCGDGSSFSAETDSASHTFVRVR